MMAWAKTKLVAAAVVGVMVIGGTGGVIADKRATAAQDEPAPPRQRQRRRPRSRQRTRQPTSLR